jgi:hypothetical protein
VPGRRIMVEGDPQRQSRAKTPAKFGERHLQPLHRLHRIAQHENAVASAQGIHDHAKDIGIHERLAAGQADLGGGRAQARRLVEEIAYLRAARGTFIMSSGSARPASLPSV